MGKEIMAKVSASIVQARDILKTWCLAQENTTVYHAIARAMLQTNAINALVQGRFPTSVILLL